MFLFFLLLLLFSVLTSSSPSSLSPVEEVFACASSLDCSLNGECDLATKTCRCDKGWTQQQCNVLSISPSSSSSVSGYHNSSFASWGGNVVVDDEGVFHMFVAQMSNNCPLDDYGSNSQIIRAESNSPMGPFEFREVVVPAFAHNPTIRRLSDGSFVLFFIGDGKQPPGSEKNCTVNSSKKSEGDDDDNNGNNNNNDTVFSLRRSRARSPSSRSSSPCGGINVIHSPSLFGPWTPPNEIIMQNCHTSQMLNCSFTNPAPHFRQDDSLVLAFQAGSCHHGLLPNVGLELLGVAHSDAWNGTYSLISGEPITRTLPWCVAGTAEDPFLWEDARGWHMLAHGMCFAPFDAMLFYSTDLVTWYVSNRRDTYSYDVQYVDDDDDDDNANNGVNSSANKLFIRMERPQLYFDQHDPVTGFLSAPSVLYTGVCEDGLKCLEHPGMTYTLARKIA